jgi:hypothetical protein
MISIVCLSLSMLFGFVIGFRAAIRFERRRLPSYVRLLEPNFCSDETRLERSAKRLFLYYRELQKDCH